MVYGMVWYGTIRDCAQRNNDVIAAAADDDDADKRWCKVLPVRVKEK